MIKEASCPLEQELFKNVKKRQTILYLKTMPDKRKLLNLIIFRNGLLNNKIPYSNWFA